MTLGFKGFSVGSNTKLHVLIYFNLGLIPINVFVRRIMMDLKPPEIKEYLLTRHGSTNYMKIP